MKKLLYLTLLVTLTLTSCSKSKGSKSTPDSFILEGTVTKVMDLLIPSAYATEFNLLEAAASEAKCGDASSCAFLISASDVEEKVLDAAPVVAGKFKFSLASKPASDAILKVVVKGWDPVNKILIEASASDREISFKGSELTGPLSVDPSSTILSEGKLLALRSKKPVDKEAESNLLQVIFQAAKLPGEMIAETLSRLMNHLQNKGGKLEIDAIIAKLFGNEDPISAKTDLAIISLENLDISEDNVNDFSSERLQELRARGQEILGLISDSRDENLGENAYAPLNQLGESFSMSFGNFMMASMMVFSAQNQINQNPNAENMSELLGQLAAAQATLDQVNQSRQMIVSEARPMCPRFHRLLRLDRMNYEISNVVSLISTTLQNRANENMATISFMPVEPEPINEPNPYVMSICCPMSDKGDDAHPQPRECELRD